MTELIAETIDVALREKQVQPRELEHVNVDTTVGEKNITYPTDSKLLLKAIQKLGILAKRRGINLRQSYVRVAKRMAQKPVAMHMPASSNACSVR